MNQAELSLDKMTRTSGKIGKLMQILLDRAVFMESACMASIPVVFVCGGGRFYCLFFLALGVERGRVVMLVFEAKKDGKPQYLVVWSFDKVFHKISG